MTVCDTSSLRRGWCPALSAPMQTGDGWLSRIALHDAISPAQLSEIARLAALHGNGIIDISARGNLQIRGLTPETAQMLEADVRRLCLPLREGLAVETGPLAGLDAGEITDPRPVADAIRARAEAEDLRQHLAPKMTVVVDGGGQIMLDALLADIRLVACGKDLWQLFTGSTLHGAVTTDHAAKAAMILLRQLAQQGRRARGRDLGAGMAGQELASLLQPAPPAAAPQPGGPLITVHGERHAASIAPAFGQCEAASLMDLCQMAQQAGIALVRPAPDHALLFIGARSACLALQEQAARHGFITTPSDPRKFIAACPGAPACASAGSDTRAMAAQIASQCGTLLDGSFTLHISGCAKGCAHPSAAGIAVVSSADNRLAIIQDGRTTDSPLLHIAADSGTEGFRRLAKLVQINRRDAETSASCIARLGPAGLKTAFIQDAP